MEGEDIYEMIRYFGERRKILYVHFRNVSGQVPRFHEEFINTGYVDMYRAMLIYHEVGFDGFFIDDHIPQTFQDSKMGPSRKSLRQRLHPSHDRGGDQGDIGISAAETPSSGGAT